MTDEFHITFKIGWLNITTYYRFQNFPPFLANFEFRWFENNFPFPLVAYGILLLLCFWCTCNLRVFSDLSEFSQFLPISIIFMAVRCSVFYAVCLPIYNMMNRKKRNMLEAGAFLNLYTTAYSDAPESCLFNQSIMLSLLLRDVISFNWNSVKWMFGLGFSYVK